MVSTCSLSSLMTPTEKTLLLLFSLWAVLVVIGSEVKWLSWWPFMVLGQDVPERTIQTAIVSTSEMSLCAGIPTVHRGESCLCAVPQMPWLPLGQGTCSVPMSPCPSALPQSEKTKAVSMTEMSSWCLLLVSVSGLFSRLTQCKAEDNLEICLGSGLWSSSVRC